MRGVPVLSFHHVNPIGSLVNATPETFEKQMRFLKENGYQTLHTNEFLAVIKGYRQVPKKAVMITFDDGWLDNWVYAFPVLQKYNHKAILFVVTSWITSGKIRPANYGYKNALPEHKECLNMILNDKRSDVVLSWEELQAMQKSGLIDVQSHTHTHTKWDELYNNHKTKMDRLSEDLRLSKETIEKRLDKKCNALCWPWGIYNKDYIDLAVSLDYELLFTEEKGTNAPEINPWRIKRIVIGNISPFTLRKKLLIHSRDWLSKLYLKIF